MGYITEDDIEKLKAEMEKVMDEKVENIVENVVKTVFDTKIEVQNGERKSLTFVEIIRQNWEQTYVVSNQVKSGDITVKIDMGGGVRVPWKLTDIINTLNRRPITTFNKISDFAEKSGNIIRFLELIGIILMLLGIFVWGR